jgi:hypothetical protein
MLKELFHGGLAALGVVGIIAIIALVIFYPFVIIWAVNTLFGFGIQYTFWTWLATLILTGAFGRSNVNVRQGK